jgi:hypothetical protein
VDAQSRGTPTRAVQNVGCVYTFASGYKLRFVISLRNNDLALLI